MAKTIGVGIIGASASRGWAKDSHVPAVQGLEGLELVAVASGSEEGAAAAKEAFGVRSAYAQGMELIGDPDVDVVTVAVKVPDHRELVLAAAAAGKHIYCEWPLGKDLGETVMLAEAAQEAGVHTAIGLQMRGSAAVRRAAELVRSGKIGRVLRAQIVSRTAAFGPEVEAAMTFGEDAANGVTLLTIQGAHTLDLAIAVLGEMEEFGALLATQFPKVSWAPEGVEHDRTTPDLVLLQGMFAAVPCGIEVIGGTKSERPSSFEVVGTEGTLRLEGVAARGVQSGRLRLFVDDQEQRKDEGETAAMPDAAANVAAMYAMLRDGIESGTRHVAGFEHAIRLSQLVADVTRSASEGIRVRGGEWPKAIEAVS